MEKKIQWHSGFCAAMELEFRGNSGDLEFVREYNLGRKPLQLFFSTQIIVGCQLREQQHIWLRSLTDSIEKTGFNEFADAVINMKQPYEKECADAIMEVVTSSNTVKLRKWMEESNMTKELLCEILGPEYEEEWKRREEKTMKKAIQQGLQQGMQQGMHITKQVIRLDAKGCPVSEIAGKVGITEEQVREILA